MELTIQQPCPACGAEITLNEDDRLVRCAFCDVVNFRVQQRLPRYTLAARLPSHVAVDELLYIPYLRFKGCIYYCQGGQVRHKLVDTTRVGCAAGTLPVSLGLRPQAMKVLPVTEQRGGGYVRQSVKAEQIFTEAARITMLYEKENKNRRLHRAFIGETVSRIYLPAYLYNDMLYDGISHRNIGTASVAEELSGQLIPFNTEWEPRFISTHCPACGDVMQGARETLVMLCGNCETQWLEEQGRFIRLDCQTVTALEDSARYLPFWQIEPFVTGYQLATFADFLRLTNQPVVIRPQHQARSLSFIVPAFKMNPSQFLQAAKALTVLQDSLQPGGEQRLDPGSAYPVTLSHSEAVEALKSILAASAVSVKKVMEILPSLSFTAQKKRLIYLPFRDAGHDCIQHQTGVSISTAALRFGRKL